MRRGRPRNCTRWPIHDGLPLWISWRWEGLSSSYVYTSNCPSTQPHHNYTAITYSFFSFYTVATLWNAKISLRRNGSTYDITGACRDYSYSDMNLPYDNDITEFTWVKQVYKSNATNSAQLQIWEFISAWIEQKAICWKCTDFHWFVATSHAVQLTIFQVWYATNNVSNL